MYDVLRSDFKKKKKKRKHGRKTHAVELIALHLRLMTDRLHHWTFFQRLHNNQVLTFFSSSARWSGSDFMIWSNSANCRKHKKKVGLRGISSFPNFRAFFFFVFTFPGRKKTLVSPNLKSLSFSPRALNKAYRGIKHTHVLNSKKKKKKILHELGLVQCARQHLAEESWIEACQLVRHVLFVHVVELMEGSSGGEAPLHQVQH